MKTSNVRQFTSFVVAGQTYGIDVLRVQEVTRSLKAAPVPLAPRFVLGLINLRGQISTAISLRELFEIAEPYPETQMNVVCRIDEVLISFVVDRVGDVLDLESRDYESAPEVIPENIRRFLEGVYKTPTALLSVIDVDKVAAFFSNGAHEFNEKSA